MNSAAADLPISATRVGRRQRTLGQLWQVPVFLLGVAAIVGVAITKPIQHSMRSMSFHDKLVEIRDGLDQRLDPTRLLALAERAYQEVGKFPDREGEVQMLLGTIQGRRAQSAVSARATELWHLSQEHLELAKTKGVPQEDRFRLDFLLGRAIYQQGKDLQRVVDLWEPSLEQGADDRKQAYQDLVKVYLDARIQNTDKALFANQKLLEQVDPKDAEAQARVRLLTAELLVKKESRAEAARELDRVVGTLTPTTLVRVRQMQIQLAEADSAWAKAVPWWNDLLPHAKAISGGAGRIWYEIGWCHRRVEPLNLALVESAWQKAVDLGGPEGQAAALRLGELVLFGKLPDPRRALLLWKTGLSGVRTSAEYKNPDIDLETVREWFDKTFRMLGELEDYANTREFAEIYKRVASPGLAEEKWAWATEQLAKETLQRSSEKGSPATPDQARELFVAAGQAYESASKMRGDVERADLLWRGSQAYFAANQPSRAAGLLDQFVKLDRTEARLAQGWYQLGEAYREQKKRELSFQAYAKCIEYPKTPFAFKARYQMACEEMDRKNYAEAQAILEQNLDSAAPLDPESHEKSLYKMGWLLLARKEYDKAGLYFKVAPNQYPGNPDAFVARFKLGEIYRILADQARAKQIDLDKENRETMTEERRIQTETQSNHHNQARLAWLDKSTEVFRVLAEDMEAKSAQATDKEKQQIRRSLFNAAENFLEKGEYVESLKQFQGLQKRFRAEIESLTAVHRICQIHTALASFPEYKEQTLEAAKQSVAAARDDIKKMSPESEAFRGHRDVWTWRQWSDWLEATHQAMNQPPPPPAKKENSNKVFD